MVWSHEGQGTLAQRWAIGLVLAFSVFFRVYGLGDRLLWHDELATRVFAAGYTVEEWKKALYTGEIFDVETVTAYQRHNPSRGVLAATQDLAENDPQHPPLYYVLTRLWVSAWGDALSTLRALSVLISLLALGGIYWLGRELFVALPRAAWTSVAILGLSPFFILYAQEAREYALWTLLIVLSSASLLAAIRRTEAHDPRSARAWAGYSLVTVIALYTSFTSASVILSQLAFLALRERLRPTPVAKRAFLSLAAAALAFVPWLITLLRHFEAFQISMRWSKEIIIPNSAILRILGHNFSRVIVDFWPELESPLSFLVMGLAVLAIALALVFTARRGPRPASFLVLILVLLPIAMLLLPDLVLGGIRSISMRYLTPAWVGVVLALGFALASVDRRGLLSAGLLLVSLASAAHNAPIAAVWTKATSVSLPAVAAEVNQTENALIVGNFERHNPGNLMALSVLLRPGTKMQFLDVQHEEHWVLPRQFSAVYLLSPIPDYRDAMDAREHARSRLILQDHFLDLWKVEPLPH
ncbi:MAG: glycosyltransferase family 39 protein [Myxococcota bacterium]